MPLPELQLIERLRRQAKPRLSDRGLGGLIIGIGDDCAVLCGSAAEDLLLKTELSVEGVHFRRDWHPPESVGHRCLVRALSDVAAMGGVPGCALLSLGLPAQMPQAWVDGFLRGFLRLAHRYKVALVGGDTKESPGGIVAGVVLLGKVPRGRAVLRSGARPGDLIYVTGEPGRSAEVLQALRTGARLDARRKAYAAHFFPEPRIRAGQLLRRRRLATAMIDLSDGLSTDLAHICAESGVAAIVYEEQLPGRELPLAARLHGGEDYELLFTAPAKARVPDRIGGVRLTCIGEVVARRRQKYPVMLVDRSSGRQKLAPQGWQHFRSRA